MELASHSLVNQDITELIGRLCGVVPCWSTMDVKIQMRTEPEVEKEGLGCIYRHWQRIRLWVWGFLCKCTHKVFFSSLNMIIFTKFFFGTMWWVRHQVPSLITRMPHILELCLSIIRIFLVSQNLMTCYMVCMHKGHLFVHVFW